MAAKKGNSNWKFASLPASERIELLKKGSKDVFDEEVERTREVYKAREELGVDTSEQERWMDTVGYAYSLHEAEKMGIPESEVAKSGYAELYLKKDGKKASEKVSEAVLGADSSEGKDSKLPATTEYKTKSGLTSTPISDAKRKIENAGKLAQDVIRERYAETVRALETEYGEIPQSLREAILNVGGHDGGGKMASAREALSEELYRAVEAVTKEMELELRKSEKKYATLADTLLEYRRDGASKASLGVIADVLIKNAAAADGYDYTLVPGVSDRGLRKASGASEDDETMTEDGANVNTYGNIVPLVSSSTDGDKDGLADAPVKEDGDKTTESDTSKNISFEDIEESASKAIRQLINEGKGKEAITLLLSLGELSEKDAKAMLELLAGGFTE